MKLDWQTLVDALCFTVILRLLMAWFVANRKLQRISFTLMGIGLFIWVISYLDFPLTRILTTSLAVPMVVLLLLSFLPEIRRAYEDARLFSFLGHQRPSSDELIVHLCQALPEMCLKRTGALLVFQGRVELKSLISGGETYDARLTHSLLVSLLNPQSPRHDGAIIIEGDRITHVGAVLPLSSLENPPEGWGTRHLAALGLSEKCDADIFIVSEERGTLSYASEGVIEEISLKSPERLEAKLGEILKQQSPSSNFLKRGKISLALWMLSIVITLIAVPTLKFIEKSRAADTKTTIMLLDVPINLTNVPDNLYVERIEASSARVYVRVPENQGAKSSTGLSIVLDLKGYSESTSTIILAKEMLKGAPESWEVTRYEPENFQVQLHQARVMDLKPESPLNGLASDLHVESILYEPSIISVLIKDMRSEADRRLQTTPINLEGIDNPGTYTFTTKIELPASIRFSDPKETGAIKATIIVAPKKPSKRNP